jgi:aspartate aminotransferase
MTGRIAERVRRINPSPSTSAAARADQLRREGHSIVNLVVGEPDFDTPGPTSLETLDEGAARIGRAVANLA